MTSMAGFLHDEEWTGGSINIEHAKWSEPYSTVSECQAVP